MNSSLWFSKASDDPGLNPLRTTHLASEMTRAIFLFRPVGSSLSPVMIRVGTFIPGSTFQASFIHGTHARICNPNISGSLRGLRLVYQTGSFLPRDFSNTPFRKPSPLL